MREELKDTVAQASSLLVAYTLGEKLTQVFLIDRDWYLKERLKFKYEGKYNNLRKNVKYKIIDKLVKNVQKKDCDSSMTGLLLIFGATFKSLNKRYIGTLRSQFDYTSDEFMVDLITHFYHITKFEYRPKGKRKADDANFNRFAYSKLRSKAYCILSKEKTNRKHVERGEDDSYEFSDGDNSDKMLSAIDCTMIRERVAHKLLDIGVSRRNIEMYSMYLDGCTNSFICRKYGLSSSRVSKIIKGIRERADAVVSELFDEIDDCKYRSDL